MRRDIRAYSQKYGPHVADAIIKFPSNEPYKRALESSIIRLLLLLLSRATNTFWRARRKIYNGTQTRSRKGFFAGIYEREGPKSRYIYKSMTKGRRASSRSVYRTRVLRNVHDETETTVTAGAKRASIISAYPFFPLLSSRFSPSAPCRAARFFSFSSLPPSATSPSPSSLLLSPPLRAGRSSALLPPLCPPRRKPRGERDRSRPTRTRNKKVIGFRYKGKFFERIFKLGNSLDFPTMPARRLFSLRQ